MKRICPGCGAIIQTSDKSKPAYIDPEVLEKRQDTYYCERCYKLKHYNKETIYTEDYHAFDEAMAELVASDGLVILVVDLFDLEGSIIPSFSKTIGKKDIIVFVNKYDLLNKHVYKDKLLSRLHDFFKEKNIKAKEVLLGSSFNIDSINTLLIEIDKYRKNRNVYFVGVTNVGKSSIINKIIEKFTNKTNILTTSNTINTTLGSIYLPLDESSFIVDTPGYRNKRSLIYYLSKKHLEFISPKSYIRPKIFQLSPKQSLFIQGFLRIDFIEGAKSSFITYFANDLLVHRTKLSKADLFYEQHKADILKIPTEPERVKMGKLISCEKVFSENLKIDISIHGLGFITLVGTGKVTIKYFENIGLEFRKALI